jgi:aminopeptidase N
MRPVIALLFSTLFITGLARAQRLPQAVLPEHYQITIAPDLQKESFAGDETISVRLTVPARSITLHAVGIEFQEETVTAGAETQRAVVATDARREMATLTVARQLSPGAAQIRLRYRGSLKEPLRGFFLSKTTRRKYASTQFEATDARRAFPCFDEPTMKATFDISLVVDRGDTAISNGKLVSDTPGPGEGKHTLKFSTSPKMSSYLAAWAVGDFGCLEGSAEGIPIRICAVPEKKDLASFALRRTEQSVHYFEEYFGIAYPFGKLDIVAIPDMAGAMENTAAIFGSEDAILLDEARASVGSRRGVAWLLSHEISHMWFGDLVTMKWWDDIWLNEGFADWVDTKPLEASNPEWNIPTDVAEMSYGAMDSDSLQSTRPIRARKAETSAEINELFDSIAYPKTAAVLRMMETYLGKEVFRQGVQAYLRKYAYGNTAAEDFWNTLAEVSNQPVREVMKSFVDQPGVPLVSAQLKCAGTSASIRLEQRRYFDSRALFEAGSSERWQIPVCMRLHPMAEGGPPATTCALLTQKEQTIPLTGCPAWLELNAEAQGYYRSAYESRDLAALTAAATSLTPVERIALLNDTWSAMRVGQSSLADYLALTEALREDTQRAVMETLTANLLYAHQYLVPEGRRDQFHAWVRNLLRPRAAELGWQAAPHEDGERRELRANVLFALGVAGDDPEVLARARTLLEQYLRDPQSLDPTLAGTVIRLAALKGDRKLYDEYKAQAEKAASPQEHNRFLYALPAFRERSLVERTLEYAASSDVLVSDAPGLIGSLLRNPAGQEAAWTFVKAHWPELKEKLGAPFAEATVVGSTSAFCDQVHLLEVKDFFTRNKVEAAERTFQQTLESIGNCIDLKAQQQAKLARWLDDHPPQPGL